MKLLVLKKQKPFNYVKIKILALISKSKNHLIVCN